MSEQQNEKAKVITAIENNERNITTEDLEKYLTMAEATMSANPNLSLLQSYQAIVEAEKKYGYNFRHRYSVNPSQNLVLKIKRAKILSELKIINNKETQIFEKRQKKLELIVSAIQNQTALGVLEIQKYVEELILSNTADNFKEAEEILTIGPIAQGFDTTQDYPIPNSLIREFLLRSFTPDILRLLKVGKITKSDQYKIAWTRYNKELFNQIDDLCERGILIHDQKFGFIAESKEKYLEAAMILEKVDSPEKLQHIYKTRAHAGHSNNNKIILLSFGVEKSIDFDYLQNISLQSEEDKMKAYILSTIGHEIGHHLFSILEQTTTGQYSNIVESEISPLREKYVTDYVLRQAVIYKNKPENVVNEDLAEAVRISTLNPSYLQKNYPRRMDFVQKNFPYIKMGCAPEILCQY
ncbi:MAG: hypothetical protein PHW01_03950 [Patescibacteria group bacterium]|nr:hypothetical protein [Patescibacteria group bacterium]